MNDLIKGLAREAGLLVYNTQNVPTKLDNFAELIVDTCCLKLLDMHEKTNGQHNYYKHAALEVKRYLGTEHEL
jgi:hypothetical protein